MTDSPNLALPYIDGGEAQPFVTHNDAVRALDALVQLSVLDRDLTTPPGSPADGQRWIVAASPTGAWAGHATQVAAWQDGAWEFYVPRTGWFAYVLDEGTLLAFNGTAWVDAMAILTALQNLTLLGIGTTADSTNPFSAVLNNALWAAKTVAAGGTGDLRYKMSKESAAKTLSLLLQDNFSGRAEIGLTGDDDLHVKVSADGSTWTEALVVDRTTGKLKIAGDVAVNTSKFNVTAASGNTAIAGTLAVADATDATSTTTGSVKLSGGIGVVKNAYVGGVLNVAGASTLGGNVGVTGTVTVTSSNASALAVGRLGATTPALQVDASTGTSITGVKVKAAATGGGVALAAIGETNVALAIDAAGSGGVTVNGTGTGAISLARNTSVTGTLAASSDFAINTSKFNVTASSGNTAIAGTLAIADTTASGSTTTGSFRTAGGAGIAKGLYVGTGVFVNTTSANPISGGVGGVAFDVGGSGLNMINTSSSPALYIGRFGTDGDLIDIYKGTSVVGSIAVTTTATAYNTSSDERRKFKFDESSIDWGERIDGIWVGDFEWREAPGNPQLGIVAQQAIAFYPQAISRDEAKDKWEASYADLSPLALWGVKDLRTRVTELEKELESLRSKLGQ